MKSITADKIVFYLFSLGFLMPALPNFIRNLVLGALVLIVFINYFNNKKSVEVDYKLLIFGSLLYVTYLISLLYTDDLELGLKKLETGASLFLVPVTFSFVANRVKELVSKNLRALYGCFIIATAVSFLVPFLYFWSQYSMSLLTHYPTLINNDIGPYSIHPIYMSMNGCVALLCSLHLFSKRKMSFLAFIAVIISSFVILIFLLILIKKGPILSLIIAGTYMTFAYKNKYIISGFIMICFVFGALIIFNKDANARFSELLTLGESENTELTSTNIRMTIYSCAKTVIPQAGFFGYGVGDAKSILLDCYQTKNQELVDSEYNSHNQYLSIILRSGFFGLFCFAAYILFAVLRLNEHKLYLAIGVILFYLLVMFSENILERENGVLYFAFLINTFLLFKENLNAKSE